MTYHAVGAGRASMGADPYLTGGCPYLGRADPPPRGGGRRAGGVGGRGGRVALVAGSRWPGSGGYVGGWLALARERPTLGGGRPGWGSVDHHVVEAAHLLVLEEHPQLAHELVGAGLDAG